MPQRDGQAYDLPKTPTARQEMNTDEAATHVAVNKEHRFKYFCRLDTETKHPQDGVPADEVPGTYWIVACDAYGYGYHGSSLWQGGFDFIPLADWDEPEADGTSDDSGPTRKLYITVSDDSFTLLDRAEIKVEGNVVKLSVVPTERGQDNPQAIIELQIGDGTS